MTEIKEFYLILSILQVYFYSIGAQCPCNRLSNVLNCNLTSVGSILDTTSCNLTSISQFEILYTNAINVNITIPSILPIKIYPGPHVTSTNLQIVSLNTRSTQVEINRKIDSPTNNQQLFTTSSIVLGFNATLTIKIKQDVGNQNNFSVFGDNVITNTFQYAIEFDMSNNNATTLKLENILHDTKGLGSLTIYGNNQNFTVNMNSSICNSNLTSLSLKNLVLIDSFLDCFPSQISFKVEQCSFGSFQFLRSGYSFNYLTLISNNPINPNMQFRSIFNSTREINTLTIDEPSFNSSILRVFFSAPIQELNLKLGSYSYRDFSDYMGLRPVIRILNIKDLNTLDVLPAGFLNSIDKVYRVHFQGTFDLVDNSTCIFTGVPLKSDSMYINIRLSSTQVNTPRWSPCAKLYVTAINENTVNNFQCAPINRDIDCTDLANLDKSCKLSEYDNGICNVNYVRPGFKYAESSLGAFLERIRRNTTTTEPSDNGSSRIIAVIAALCGLLVAIAILVVTVFFILRKRRRESTAMRLQNETSKEMPPPNYNDLSHLSIATTRTTKSVYPTLDQGIFPTINPNDQIAPSLYTAPSESYPLAINGKQKSAQISTRRASTLTNNTHHYETLES